MPFRIKNIRAIIFCSAFLFLASSVFAQDAKVFFSPQGGCEQAIVAQLSRAQSTAEIAMYNLTSEPIAQEIVRMKQRGVTVRIVLDRSQRGQKSSKAGFLKQRGIEVRIYQGGGLMHDKFAILDGKALITGSFNWTKNAEEDNAENLLVLYDPKLIAPYVQEFTRLWEKGQEADVRESFDHTLSGLANTGLRFLRELMRGLR